MIKLQRPTDPRGDFFGLRIGREVRRSKEESKSVVGCPRNLGSMVIGSMVYPLKVSQAQRRRAVKLQLPTCRVHLPTVTRFKLPKCR